MRFTEFLLSKSNRLIRFIYVLLLGAFVTTSQSAFIRAQSLAPAAGQDESARPLELANSSAGSGAAAVKKSPIGQQSQMLFKMAQDLEKEVSRTTDQTISAAAVRKADQIEKFAKELAAVGRETASR